MSHDSRTWFVGDFNEQTNKFLCDGNIAGFDQDTDFLIDVKVRTNGSTVGKNLIRVPSSEAISTMRNHKRRFRMNFRVYVRDSPGSQIVLWVGERSSVNSKPHSQKSNSTKMKARK